MIEYTIYKESSLDKLKKKFTSKAEDIFLSVVLWIAKISNSQRISNWLEKHLDAKTQKLQHELIRQNWDKVKLEKIVTSIHESN